MKSLSIVLTICCTLIGCGHNIVETKPPEKTYPDSFDFTLTDVSQILNGQVSGSVNLKVYVAEISDCIPEPNVRCSEPGLWLSQEPDSLLESDYVILPAKHLDQFSVGQRYIVSLNVAYYSHAVTNKPVPVLELLGYDLAMD